MNTKQIMALVNEYASATSTSSNERVIRLASVLEEEIDVLVNERDELLLQVNQYRAVEKSK